VSARAFRRAAIFTGAAAALAGVATAMPIAAEAAPSGINAELVTMIPELRANMSRVRELEAADQGEEAFKPFLDRLWALLDRAAELPATSTEALLAKAAMITDMLLDLAAVHGCDTLTALGESRARSRAEGPGMSVPATTLLIAPVPRRQARAGPSATRWFLRLVLVPAPRADCCGHRRGLGHLV